MKSVREDGEAFQAGLRIGNKKSIVILKIIQSLIRTLIGDRIINVNGTSVIDHKYSQVVQQIKMADGPLNLIVVPPEDDILQIVS